MGNNTLIGLAPNLVGLVIVKNPYKDYRVLS